MEAITIDGQQYVKASAAARQAGYTADYVGQLARSGAIPAKLLGRTWYVDPESLRTHRVEKKRAARVKAREQVKQAIQARSSGSASMPVRSRYSEDKDPLIPEVARTQEAETKIDEGQDDESENSIAHVTAKQEDGYIAVALNKKDEVVEESAPAKKEIGTWGTASRQVIAPRRAAPTVQAVIPVSKPSMPVAEDRMRLKKAKSSIGESISIPEQPASFRMSFGIIALIFSALIVAAIIPIFEIHDTYTVEEGSRVHTAEYVLNIGSILSKIRF